MGCPDILEIIKGIFNDDGQPWPDICGYTVEYGDPEPPEEGAYKTVGQMMTEQLRAAGLLPETMYVSSLLRKGTLEDEQQWKWVSASA